MGSGEDGGIVAESQMSLFGHVDQWPDSHPNLESP